MEIICKQDATARFICSRLFQFFAADEIDAEGERVIERMVAAYFESDYEIRSALRTLFNSDYFKGDAARYARVKAPGGDCRGRGAPRRLVSASRHWASTSWRIRRSSWGRGCCSRRRSRAGTRASSG